MHCGSVTPTCLGDGIHGSMETQVRFLIGKEVVGLSKLGIGMPQSPTNEFEKPLNKPIKHSTDADLLSTRCR